MTKAMSRAKRRRRKKAARKAPQQATGSSPQREASVSRPVAAESAKPTPEAMRHGCYVQGDDGKGAPFLNRDVDMLGKLAREGKISAGQLDAGRLWQQVRAAYVAELGTAGYRSCLDGSQGGYDGGDGNVMAVREYNALRERIGRVASATLTEEADKGPVGVPYNLALLKNALDLVNGG